MLLLECWRARMGVVGLAPPQLAARRYSARADTGRVCLWLLLSLQQVGDLGVALISGTVLGAKAISIPVGDIRSLLEQGLYALIMTLMVIGNAQRAAWTPSSQQFKSVLTFCISILNVTTVLIVARYFEATKQQPTTASAPVQAPTVPK